MPKPSPLRNSLSPNEPRSAADVSRLSVPLAEVRSLLPSGAQDGFSREVRVTLAHAPMGSRVYLESQPVSGPNERISAIELPFQPALGRREYRALLPPSPPGSEGSYVPVAVCRGQELRGERFWPHAAPHSEIERRPSVHPVKPPSVSRGVEQQIGSGRLERLPFPAMELLAHVEADLPNATVFGATPEGLRITFFIAGGRWSGPRIQARYRSEGGDWIVVRRDGVAIPNARATLETSDGALLYYELTGTIDLGPDGYEHALASNWPNFAALSIVARVSTTSERWKWLNRLTLVGAGVVNLKLGHTVYDLYSIQCEAAVLLP